MGEKKDFEEEKTEMNASLISNVSSIRMIVPPYRSPPGPGVKDNERNVKQINLGSDLAIGRL
jgi:hypothetical protein